jgi:hypothetical protein
MGVGMYVLIMPDKWRQYFVFDAIVTPARALTH